jgi:hypothetical protein
MYNGVGPPFPEQHTSVRKVHRRADCYGTYSRTYAFDTCSSEGNFGPGTASTSEGFASAKIVQNNTLKPVLG